MATTPHARNTNHENSLSSKFTHNISASESSHFAFTSTTTAARSIVSYYFTANPLLY